MEFFELFDQYILYSMVIGSLVGGALFGMLAIGFLMALAGIAVIVCAGITAAVCDMIREWWANKREEVKP